MAHLEGRVVSDEVKEALELMDKDGQLTIQPKRAAKLVDCEPQTLYRYSVKHPDKLQRIPWGKKRIRYRYDQIRHLAYNGMK